MIGRVVTSATPVGLAVNVLGTAAAYGGIRAWDNRERIINWLDQRAGNGYQWKHGALEITNMRDPADGPWPRAGGQRPKVLWHGGPPGVAYGPPDMHVRVTWECIRTSQSNKVVRYEHGYTLYSVDAEPTVRPRELSYGSDCYRDDDLIVGFHMRTAKGEYCKGPCPSGTVQWHADRADLRHRVEVSVRCRGRDGATESKTVSYTTAERDDPWRVPSCAYILADSHLEHISVKQGPDGMPLQTVWTWGGLTPASDAGVAVRRVHVLVWSNALQPRGALRG
jgi:hypothetical protein